MEISFDQQSKAVVVAVKGRMDAVSAPEFERAMAGHIESGSHRFVVDCSALEYVSSAGLRSLLTTVKTLRPHDGELVFASLRDVVREVFEIAGFEAIFPVFDSTEAAMQRW